MTPGVLSRACLRVVDRYQRSDAARVYDKRCRFSPSCSAYLYEGFSTRAFPVAFVLSAWRLARCNPLTRPQSADPLVRRSRWRARANAMQTTFALMFVGGFLTLLVAGPAFGQHLEGGCVATVNGVTPTRMTASNPLVVRQGDSVSVRGTAPPGAAAGDVSTIVRISLIKDLAQVSTHFNNGNGTTWGGSVSIDQYLKYGRGLYYVTAVGRVSGGAWECFANGFIHLSGNPLATPVGAGATGATVVGGVGGALAPGRKPTKDSVLSDVADDVMDVIGTPGPSTGEVKTGQELAEGWDAQKKQLRYDVLPSGGCCLLPVMLLPIGVLPIVGMGGGAMPAAAGAVILDKRKWKRGHAVLGFLSGLLFGLGVTVLLQQYAVWPLTIWTAIVFPAGLAVLSGIRSWVGRSYRLVVSRTGEAGFASPPPPSYTPPPPAAPVTYTPPPPTETPPPAYEPPPPPTYEPSPPPPPPPPQSEPPPPHPG